MSCFQSKQPLLGKPFIGPFLMIVFPTSAFAALRQRMMLRSRIRTKQSTGANVMAALKFLSDFPGAKTKFTVNKQHRL